MRIESSIITSLSELRAIEHQRIADERAAVEQARAAESEARRAAEQARLDAEQARLRAEREAAMRIEQARVEAEREARMRVEATEAAERARLQAAIEQQRMADEMELRRAEVAKQRPRWMLAVTGAALVATIAFGWYAVEQAREAERSDHGRTAALNEKREAIAQAQAAREELARLAQQLDELDVQVAKAQALLLSAQTKADRDRVSAEINEANRRRAAIKLAQEQAERHRIEEERKAGAHFGADCFHDTLGCLDGKKSKKRK